MRRRFSLLGSNPLLKRVQRITAMPTLYRALDQSATGPVVSPQTAAGVTGTSQAGPAGQARQIGQVPPIVATLFRPSAQGQLPAADEAIQRVQAPARPGPLPQMAPPAAAPRQPAVQPSTPALRPPAVQAAPAAQAPSRAPVEAQPSPPSPQAGQTEGAEGGDWDWIDDKGWNQLKSLMAAHEKRAADERAGQAELQRSPEEIQRAEAAEAAKAEAARRQELARSGQLPRAQVVYMSPEEKALKAGPLPVSPAAPEASQPSQQPLAQEPPAQEVPDSALPLDEAAAQLPVETDTTAAPPATTPAAFQREPDVAQAPDAEATSAPEAGGQPPEPARQPAATPQIRRTAADTRPAAKPESEMKPEAEAVPEAEAPAIEETANVGQRLLRAARSLFRREDEEVDEPGPEKAQVEESPGEMISAGEDVVTSAPEGPPPAAAPALQRDQDTTLTEQGPEALPEPELAPWPQAAETPPAPAAGPEPSGMASAHDVAPDAPESPAIQLEPQRPDMTASIEGLATPPDEPAVPVVAELPGSESEVPAEATFADADVSSRPGTPSEAAPVGQEPSRPAPVQQAADDNQQVTQERPAESVPEFVDDDQDTVIASMPLQSVWPVEQRPERPARAPEPAAKAQPAKPAVQRKAAGGESVGEEVHSALRDVAPGKVTDSSIELVTPRRPRPVPRPPEISRQGDSNLPDSGSLPDTGTPPVDASPPAAGEQAARPLELTSPPEVTPAAESTVQSSAAEAPVQSPTAEAPVTRPAPVERPADQTQMIQTEIGELPSDLWRLLGEDPPSPRPSPPAAPASPVMAQRELAAAAPAIAEMTAAQPMQAVAEKPAASARAIETTVAAPEMSPLVTRSFAPPAAQRIEEEVATERTSETSGETSESEESGQGGAEVDIDALARKVLPEVKRRLAIDWERGRGRIR